MMRGILQAFLGAIFGIVLFTMLGAGGDGKVTSSDKADFVRGLSPWRTYIHDLQDEIIDAKGNYNKLIDKLDAMQSGPLSAIQWTASGQTPTFVDSDTFSVPTNMTDKFEAGRRIRAELVAGNFIYSQVTSSSFTSNTTTVNVDTTNLTSSLSAVSYSFLDAGSDRSIQGASSSEPGVIQLAGDLGGTASAPTVTVSATNRLLGRSTAGAGDMEEIAVGGDITQNGSTFTVANDAVTYAKMQNVSATDKVIGRSTAGAGDPEEIAFNASARDVVQETWVDDQIWISDSSSAGTPRSIPPCADTGGNHLNYTASTNSFSCGTSASTTYTTANSQVATCTGAGCTATATCNAGTIVVFAMTRSDAANCNGIAVTETNGVIGGNTTGNCLGDTSCAQTENTASDAACVRITCVD